jgi:hypothetical protein
VARGSASNSRVKQRAKGVNQGKLWIPEEVGSLLQKDDRKNWTRYSVEQEGCKSWTFGKRHCMKLKGSHGIKNQDVKEQLV